MSRGALLLVALLLGLVWPTAARAQDPSDLPEKTFRVKLNSDKLNISTEYREVFDKKRLEQLELGKTITILVRAYLYDEGDTSAPISLSLREVQIYYDVWAEEFTISAREAGSSWSSTTSEKKKALGLAGDLTDLTLPLGAPLRSSQRYFLAVIVEVNPIPEAVKREMQRWLSRTSTSGVRSSSFFGSFVSIFANIQKGSAEKTLRFRSPTFSPPAPKKE